MASLSVTDILKIAIYNNDLVNAKAALEAGANPNAKITEKSKYNGYSLMHLAISLRESVSLLKLMLKYGGDPNNAHGSFPLLPYIIIYGSHTKKTLDIIETLIAAGANPVQVYTKDKITGTAIDAAKYIMRKADAKFGSAALKILEKARLHNAQAASASRSMSAPSARNLKLMIENAIKTKSKESKPAKEKKETRTKSKAVKKTKKSKK